MLILIWKQAHSWKITLWAWCWCFCCCFRRHWHCCGFQGGQGTLLVLCSQNRHSAVWKNENDFCDNGVDICQVLLCHHSYFSIGKGFIIHKITMVVLVTLTVILYTSYFSIEQGFIKLMVVMMVMVMFMVMINLLLNRTGLHQVSSAWSNTRSWTLSRAEHSAGEFRWAFYCDGDDAIVMEMMQLWWWWFFDDNNDDYANNDDGQDKPEEKSEDEADDEGGNSSGHSNHHHLPGWC